MTYVLPQILTDNNARNLMSHAPYIESHISNKSTHFTSDGLTFRAQSLLPRPPTLRINLPQPLNLLHPRLISLPHIEHPRVTINHIIMKYLQLLLRQLLCAKARHIPQGALIRSSLPHYVGGLAVGRDVSGIVFAGFTAGCCVEGASDIRVWVMGAYLGGLVVALGEGVGVGHCCALWRD